MIAIIKKIFEANPETSKIELKGKCSDCGREIDINITPISRGVGLSGGALSEFSPNRYSADCPDCYNVVSLTTHHFRLKKSKKTQGRIERRCFPDFSFNR